eukprot:403375851
MSRSNISSFDKVQQTKFLQAVDQMRLQYAGVGRNGYLGSAAQKAVRTSIRIVEDQNKLRLSKIHESVQSLIKRPTNVNTMIRQHSSNKNLQLNNPYQDIQEQSQTSSSSDESSDDNSIEIKSHNNILKFDLDAYKYESSILTDRQKQKKEFSRIIRKSVKKEIKTVEKMFPLSLSSARSRKQSRNDHISQLYGNNQVIRTQNESRFNNYLETNPNSRAIQNSQEKSYFNISKTSQNQSYSSFKNAYQDSRPITSQKDSQFRIKLNRSILNNSDLKTQNNNNNNNESFISEISDSPYKIMPEKKIMFKILDKHQQVLNNKKKRQDQLQRVGFIKGIFNDKSLAWEMRNNSTRASNFASLKVISTATHDRSDINKEDLRALELQRDQRLTGVQVPGRKSNLKSEDLSRMRINSGEQQIHRKDKKVTL